MRTGMRGTSIALLGLLLVSGWCLVPVAAGETRVGPAGWRKGEYSFEARCAHNEFVLMIQGRQSYVIDSIQLGCATLTSDGYKNTTTLGPFGGEGGTAFSSDALNYPWIGAEGYSYYKDGDLTGMYFLGTGEMTGFFIGEANKYTIPERFMCPPAGAGDDRPQVVVGIFGTYGPIASEQRTYVTELGLICDTVQEISQLGMLKGGSGNDGTSVAKSLGNRMKESIRASYFIRGPPA